MLTRRKFIGLAGAVTGGALFLERGMAQGARPVLRKPIGEKPLIPFYANSFVLGHQWNRVCRLRVSGSWARTRHRSATASIISSRSRKYRLATASFTKGHTRSTGGSSGL